MTDLWHRELFGLVTADAVRRHLLRPIVEWLGAEGLRVVAFHVTDITPLGMDGLYEAHLVNTADAYRYRALDARMALGPAVALRLAPPAGAVPIEHWYSRLQQIKGASSPAESQPGSLRHDLRAVNTILSLLHCSDAPAFARREADLMLGQPAESLPWQDGPALHQIADVLEAMTVREERGFCEVLTGLRGGVLLRLWDALDDDGRALAAKLIGTAGLCAHDAGERLCEHLAADARRGPLAGILAAPFDPGAPPVDIGRVRRHLAAAAVPFDDWSEAVLGSSMYFEPRRSAAQ